MTLNKQQRGFFQLHLSTALVLMVLAAGLLGLNLVPREHNYGLGGSARISGWPWTLNFHNVYYPDFNISEMLILRDPSPATRATREYQDALEKHLGLRYSDEMGVHNSWQSRFLGNVAVALGILTLAAVLLEWRLRRAPNKENRA